jgi:D-sedoheptulose 7-phosphate isomerase
MSITVFTNGCFDILHPGHVDLLERARGLGTRLVVGINSDESIRAIKGPTRPVVNQESRSAVLRGLRWVDEVRTFDEPTPARLIAEIAPDVLVKGGDWPIDQIIGADLVLARGGQVYSLPLLEGYSSSDIIARMPRPNGSPSSDVSTAVGTAENVVIRALKEHLQVFESLLADCVPAIVKSGDEIQLAFQRGRKVLIFGNGGSASDAQHLAAEFVGRYEAERRGLPAIALTTDTSALTAITNDYGFERVFARQVEALAVEGDVAIGISTSGDSANIIAGLMSARSIGCYTIGLTGAGGKRLASLCDVAVMVPSERTARIQEAHGAIGHIWCQLVDQVTTT